MFHYPYGYESRNTKSKLNMNKTLRYEPIDTGYTALVMLSEISRMYKSMDGETTYIVTKSGETLSSSDSINTLEARLNSDS